MWVLNEAKKYANTQIELVESKADLALTTANTADGKADNLQSQIDVLVVDGDSSVEAAQARVDINNKTYTTLKERLDAEQNDLAKKAYKTELDIRNTLVKNKAKIREQIYPINQSKKVLLLYHGGTPTPRQTAFYLTAREILKSSRIPFDELEHDMMMPPADAANYSLIIAPYIQGTDIYNNPSGLFGGNVGAPVIVFGGGAGWDGRTNRTHVSTVLTNGTHHYKMPGGYDYYTNKSDRFCNATISNMTDVENIVYDPLDNTKSNMWIVRGATNDTLWMPAYVTHCLIPALLYYIKLWGGYKNALPLPLCYDLDDANISESPYTASVQGLSDLYDWAKPLNILITSGIKTDYIEGPTAKRFPTGLASEQTAFLRDHQDVFIPIVHDHHYGTWGQTNAKATLISQHIERLTVARQYGFAIPDDMYGYLFQPSNEYNENAIAVWKEYGIVAARDSGSALGVWSSDGITPIPFADRYSLTKDKILWVNACQYTGFDSASLEDELTSKGYTEEQWKGLAITRTLIALFNGFPVTTHKTFDDITNGNYPRASTVYFHGTNVSGDNPMLIGMQLVEGVRKAFPGTFCYTHPSCLINRSETSYLEDAY